MIGGSDNDLYQQNGLPIFQNKLYETLEEAIASKTGDVRLIEDPQTGLIRNAAFDPSIMIYDTSYQNEQGLSQTFIRHLEDVEVIVTNYLGRDNIIEVGCGKGLFLEMLRARGVSITGFDPAYEGNDPQIRREYFRPGSGIEAHGLILRHVLEHIPNPVGFLRDLKEANGGAGLVYIEVPCFDWIMDNRAWFDIFYEHVNYFRLVDFSRIFGRIIASGRIFGEQYLYVIADLCSLQDPVIDEATRVKMPNNFDTAVRNQSFDEHAVVWGGASKGVIFSLLRLRNANPVKTVIDINPAKQGKFLPLSGIRVQSPDEALKTLPPNSNIYVMNRNYLHEIKRMSGDRFNYIEIDRLG